jgi:hypothetical protein
MRPLIILLAVSVAVLVVLSQPNPQDAPLPKGPEERKTRKTHDRTALAASRAYRPHRFQVLLAEGAGAVLVAGGAFVLLSSIEAPTGALTIAGLALLAVGLLFTSEALPTRPSRARHS